MATPSRYHHVREALRDPTAATGVVVMVYEEDAGTGFSAIGSPECCEALPAALRQMADPLEAGNRAARMRPS